MPGFERRIGERFEVGDVRVTWSVSKAPRQGRDKRPAGRAKADPSFLRNVSMSGAGVLASRHNELGPGAAVEVHLDEETFFLGRVKRVLPTADPAWAYYGISYTQVSEPFQLWLNTLANAKRAELKEHSWNTSW